MGQIEGTNRDQLQVRSLDEMVGDKSIVRVIDRFIDVVDLKAMGFTRVESAATGRSGYGCSGLTKLYVYGFGNGVRTGRKLQRETEVNVEAMWLMEGLTPSYKTICEFRRQNIRPLQKLFREFVKLCKSWELLGGEVVAVDGTKIKASNNKKNNFSRKKLDERMARIDEKIAQYLNEMEACDGQEVEQEPEGLLELLARKEQYEGYLQQMEESGDNEVSTVDPDARLMGNNRGGVDVCYNVQSAVDGKHHLIMDYDVTKNPSDQHELGRMVKKVKRLHFKRFIVVADKGYYNGADLKRVKGMRVKAVVSKQKPSDRKDQPETFHTGKFHYDQQADAYTCPLGKTLHAHSKKDTPRRHFFDKATCADCPHLGDCTQDKRGYRRITRSEYADIYEEADRNFRENLHIYKLRQQIVEHPFGTIKHFMHGSHFLLRTRRKVRSEVALLFLGYNLKRALKVLGFKEIMARLDAVCACFRLFSSFWACFGHNSHFLPDCWVVCVE